MNFRYQIDVCLGKIFQVKICGAPVQQEGKGDKDRGDPPFYSIFFQILIPQFPGAWFLQQAEYNDVFFPGYFPIP